MWSPHRARHHPFKALNHNLPFILPISDGLTPSWGWWPAVGLDAQIERFFFPFLNEFFPFFFVCIQSQNGSPLDECKVS